MSAVTNTGQNDELKNFQEAWYHQNKEKGRTGEWQYAKNLKI